MAFWNRKKAQVETDPVCGMSVDPANAAGSETFEGRAFYFCSRGCQASFRADPARYAAAATRPNRSL